MELILRLVKHQVTIRILVTLVSIAVYLQMLWLVGILDEPTFEKTEFAGRTG